MVGSSWGWLGLCWFILTWTALPVLAASNPWLKHLGENHRCLHVVDVEPEVESSFAVILGVKQHFSSSQLFCRNFLISLDNLTDVHSMDILPAFGRYYFTGGTKHNREVALSAFPHSIYVQTCKNGRFCLRRKKNVFSLSSYVTAIVKPENINNFLTEKAMEKCPDFGGHRIRAVAFTLKPLSLPDFENGVQHEGSEFRIAEAAAAALGLRLDVRPTSDGERWGREEPPGSGYYTGLVGDLHRGEAEIGWGNILMSENRQGVIDFSDLYTVDTAAVFLKRPEPYSAIYKLLMPLDVASWTGLVTCAISLAIFFILIRKSTNMQTCQGFRTFLLVVSLLLNESTQPIHQQRSFTFRISSGLAMLALFVVSSSYSGSLTSFFTANLYPKGPQTLEELAKYAENKKLDVRFCCSDMMRHFEESQLESYQTIWKRTLKEKINFGEVVEYVAEGTGVYILAKRSGENLRRTNQNWKYYASTYFMQETFLPTPVALGLKKKSLLKEAINEKLMYLREAGLVNYWIEKGQEKMSKNSMVSFEGTKPIGKKPEVLSLRALAGVFTLHAILLGLCLLMPFMCEIIKEIFVLNEEIRAKKRSSLKLIKALKRMKRRRNRNVSRDTNAWP